MPADLDQVRSQLDAAHADLERQLGELEVEAIEITDEENFADSAQVAAEQGESLSHAATLREQLVEVEGALARLDDGSYGTCEVCGKAISDARLDALPATRFCIDHA